MENGDLPDQHFTSSSDGGPEKVAWKSRLNNDQAAWCAGENNANQYLQVDLGRSRTVSRVASQGHPGSAFWVTSFGLAYSVDGIFWRKALDERKSMVMIFDYVTLLIFNNPDALGNHTRRSRCVKSDIMRQKTSRCTRNWNTEKPILPFQLSAITYIPSRIALLMNLTHLQIVLCDH